MSDKPMRIQLRRAKGWRMPPNTVKVSRPSIWGNPFTVSNLQEAGFKGTRSALNTICVDAFRDWLRGSNRDWIGPQSEAAREAILARLIERRPAVQVMQQNDRPGTLFYVDPPYLPETRDKGTDYRHEMTRDQHLELLGCLTALRGFVVLSGYASALYDDALKGWRRIEIKAVADGGAPRTEVIWCNFPDTCPLLREAPHA